MFPIFALLNPDPFTFSKSSKPKDPTAIAFETTCVIRRVLHTVDSDITSFRRTLELIPPMMTDPTSKHV